MRASWKDKGGVVDGGWRDVSLVRFLSLLLSFDERYLIPPACSRTLWRFYGKSKNRKKHGQAD